MSTHMNFLFLVDRTLLKTSLGVVRYAIGVVTSPGKLIIFTITVSCVQRISDFCGCISATILP